MWFTIALEEINDIPAGTLLKITKYTQTNISVETCPPAKKDRAILHQPNWWIRTIGLKPELLDINNLRNRRYKG